MPQVVAGGHGSAQAGGENKPSKLLRSPKALLVLLRASPTGLEREAIETAPCRGESPIPLAAETLSLTLCRCSALPARDGDSANVLTAALLQRPAPALRSCCGTNPLSSSMPQFTDLEKGRGTPRGAVAVRVQGEGLESRQHGGCSLFGGYAAGPTGDAARGAGAAGGPHAPSAGAGARFSHPFKRLSPLQHCEGAREGAML